MASAGVHRRGALTHRGAQIVCRTGHSRSQNGIASLAYAATIHDFSLHRTKDMDGRIKSGHDGVGMGA